MTGANAEDGQGQRRLVLEASSRVDVRGSSGMAQQGRWNLPSNRPTSMRLSERGEDISGGHGSKEKNYERGVTNAVGWRSGHGSAPVRSVEIFLGE